jgi:hypothetical protein
VTGLVHRRPALAAAAAGAAAAGAAVVEYTRTGSPAEAATALPAGAIAVAVAGLVLSLPGLTVRGATIGGLSVAAGIFTWTFTSRPIVIWLVLAGAGAVCALWTWPWLRGLRALPRLGAAWLGLAYWPLGVAGALLVGHVTVADQRIAYFGVFALLALAAARRGSGRDDVSLGIASAMLVAIAALLLVGSGSLLDPVHAVPDQASAQHMRDRFWGGAGLFYQPNSMAGLAVAAAVRIGPDRVFAAWQRLAVLALGGLMLVVTDSRSGFVFAAAAAVVHAVLVLRGPGRTAPDRRRWLAALTPFAVLTLVLILSGGVNFLVRDRFNPGGSDVTSGRVDTWRQVASDWQHAGWAEKLFGDARTSRAVVTRTNDGAPPEGPRRKLNTDNAAVGALRRGGVLGAAAFLIGLVLLLRHAAGRAGPRGTTPWFGIAAVAVLPTIATEDWLLGGTNGAIWLLLLAGEATALRRPVTVDLMPAAALGEPPAAPGPATRQGDAPRTGTSPSS